MDKNNSILNFITDDDIDQVTSLMQQNMAVLFLDDIFDFLCKEILILNLMKGEVMQCPLCRNICMGIKDLVSHIQQKHRVAGIYYEDIQIIPHSLDNINPLRPPSKLYFCAYCGFPTSDAHGLNPTSDMFRHIEKDCKKTTSSPRQIKFTHTADAEFIKKYLTQENSIDVKICKKCEDILGREELIITHYIDKHCELGKCPVNTIKEIFNNPSGYLADNLSAFDNLVNTKKEYINHNRISVSSYIRRKLDTKQDFVSFSNSWLLNSKLLCVDINKIAEELEKYPNGLNTDNLVNLVFDDKDAVSLPIRKFSLCYALQQNGNFLYDFEQDIWKFKLEISEDSPEEEEILPPKRSPSPRVSSKIKLEEEMIPDSTEHIDKELDTATWRRIKKDEIHYLLFFTYIYNGFLPYDENARRLFPPNVRRVYFSTDYDKKFTVRIDKDGRSIYSRELKNLFHDIPAGTIVYIKRLDSDRSYKIYFKEKLQLVTDCRIARYDEIKKEVIYEIRDLELKYECVPPIFKAELRFSDLKALWEEARLSGYSISDLVYIEFSKLAKLTSNKIVHFNDIYNGVFFRRMCSPGGVWSILKRHPAYYKYEGNKFWKFVEEEDRRVIENKTTEKRSYPKVIYITILATIILLLIFIFLKFLKITRFL